MFVLILNFVKLIYFSWIFLAILWNVGSCIWRTLGRESWSLSMLCTGPKVEVINGSKVLVAAEIHQNTTLPQIKREWFSVKDIASRLCVAGASFCLAMLCRPFSLIHFTFMYNRIFSGMGKAVMSVLLLPFYPVLMLLNNALYQRNLSFLPMLNVKDEDLQSLQFFTNKLDPFASFLYDFSQEFCNYIGNFYIIGPCPDAIATMYWDTEKTTKLFWREKLRKCGAQIPREVGIWDGAVLDIKDDVMKYGGVVIKVANSCMGVGDVFLKKSTDYSSVSDIEDIFRTKYQDRKCLLLELIRPKKDLGVHSLDILTARDSQGRVQLVDVIVWAGSKSATSHGATAAYMIDPKTERACTLGDWYNPNFVGTTPTGLGMRYPNVGEAVNLALHTHRNLPYPWLNVVGWDCMVTEDSSIVFFEGNLAAWRCPRRLFLSWKNFIYFVNYLSWVTY